MKSILNFLFFFLTISALSGQDIDLFSLEERPCSSNPSVTVSQIRNYEMYQTEDGSENGTRLDQCISAYKSGFRRFISLDEIDTSLPLYLKSIPGAFSNSDLDPTSLYALYLDLNGEYMIGKDCQDCSTISIWTAIPNEDNTGNVLTANNFFFDENQRNINTCLVTQKFGQGQFIEKVVIKLVFDPNLFYDDLKFPSSSLELSFSEAISNKIIPLRDESKIDENTFELFLHDLVDFRENVIVPHLNPGYPSNENFSFIDLSPINNRDTPFEINLIQREWESLGFQNFTGLRGGLIQGGDSTHHTLNLFLRDNLCLFSVEVIITNDGSLNFSRGSSLDIYGSGACIQMRDESELRVEKHHNLIYGTAGDGMLALRNNSSLRLEAWSELFFDGEIVLYSGQETGKNLGVYLDLGSKLVFGEKVKISNHRDPSQKLNIFVGRGHVDISKMAEEERSKINLIFDKEDSLSKSSYQVIPNPAIDKILLNKEGESVKFTILNMMGQVIFEGNSQHSIYIADLDPGYYILRFADGQSVKSGKFFKQ